MKILILIGGISKGSINKQLFNNFKELAGGKFEFDVVDITALPYYSQDYDENLPSVVQDMKTRVKTCDGVLFVTPEYNRSIPGVLKNAIDWGSRPYGANCWDGKPTAIIGATISAVGTFGAQNHLRQILTEVSVPVMVTPRLYYTYDMQDGKVSVKTADHLKKFINAFALWVEKEK